MPGTRRSKYNEHFDQMDGSYVCRVCSDVFTDNTPTNKSQKMRAHLMENHPELVLKHWPRTAEEMRTFLLPDLIELQRLVNNLYNVTDELDAIDKISDVVRMGRQLERLIRRYEDRVGEPLDRITIQIVTGAIEFPDYPSISALKAEQIFEETNKLTDKPSNFKHYQAILPDLALKYSKYYKSALQYSEVLINRFNEPCLFESIEFAQLVMTTTKRDVSNHCILTSKPFGKLPQ